MLVQSVQIFDVGNDRKRAPFKKAGLLLVCFALGNFLNAQTDWELKKNKNEISIYTRDVEGSSFKELKATTTFSGSLSGLIALITDIPSHPLWIYRCSQTKLIKKIGTSELYYYVETYVPWPASNRDGVVNFKISQDSKTKIVTVASVGMSGILPEIKGDVRVPKLIASWKFTPKADGTIDGEYQLNVDPGGEVPAWIVNMFAIDGPYNSLINMKKLLVQDKYQSAKFDFIKN